MEPKIRKFAASYNVLPYFLSLILAIMFGYAEYNIFIGKFSSGILRSIYLFLFAALTILCLIFLLKGFLLALNFYSYSADKTGINYNTPIKTMRFLSSQIKKVEVLNPDEAKNLIMKEEQKYAYAGIAYSPNSKEMIDLLKYSTYKPGLAYSMTSGKMNFSGLGLISTRLKILKPILNIDFILLKLKNGKIHLLSPKEPEKFIMEFNSKIR